MAERLFGNDDSGDLNNDEDDYDGGSVVAEDTTSKSTGKRKSRKGDSGKISGGDAESGGQDLGQSAAKEKEKDSMDIDAPPAKKTKGGKKNKQAGQQASTPVDAPKEDVEKTTNVEKTAKKSKSKKAKTKTNTERVDVTNGDATNQGDKPSTNETPEPSQSRPKPKRKGTTAAKTTTTTTAMDADATSALANAPTADTMPTTKGTEDYGPAEAVNLTLTATTCATSSDTPMSSVDVDIPAAADGSAKLNDTTILTLPSTAATYAGSLDHVTSPGNDPEVSPPITPPPQLSAEELRKALEDARKQITVRVSDPFGGDELDAADGVDLHDEMLFNSELNNVEEEGTSNQPQVNCK